MTARLTVLICTFNDRIINVPQVLLSPRDDISYIISFQYTSECFLDMIPLQLQERSDTRLVAWEGIGLSANRNYALQYCFTELAIIADDDVKYTHQAFDRVLQLFDDNPHLDIACLKLKRQNGTWHKSYPDYPFPYQQSPKGYFVSSAEIILRLDREFPTFDTRLGLGTPYCSCGEEEVFLYQAWRLGANIQYFPIELGIIPNTMSTGETFMTDVRVRRSKGAVLYILYGLIGGFLRILKFSLFFTSTGISRYRVFVDLLEGMRFLYKTSFHDCVDINVELD